MKKRLVTILVGLGTALVSVGFAAQGGAGGGAGGPGGPGGPGGSGPSGAQGGLGSSFSRAGSRIDGSTRAQADELHSRIEDLIRSPAISVRDIPGWDVLPFDLTGAQEIPRPVFPGQGGNQHDVNGGGALGPTGLLGLATRARSTAQPTASGGDLSADVVAGLLPCIDAALRLHPASEQEKAAVRQQVRTLASASQGIVATASLLQDVLLRLLLEIENAQIEEAARAGNAR